MDSPSKILMLQEEGWQVKTKLICYDTLPEEAVQIREEVFMREQGFQEEFDEIDGRAVHLVLYCDGSPAAVCRFYQDRMNGEYLIGRLAVRKAYRGKGIGAVPCFRKPRRKSKGGEAGRPPCMPRDRRSPFMKSRVMLHMGRRILMKAVPMSG